MTPPPGRPRVFAPSTWTGDRTLRDLLRMETTGGMLLLIAATAAMIWANLPWSDAYESLRSTRIGPDRITIGPVDVHLGLSAAQWASDGLLAVFFFVAGIEVKREFVTGDLREPRRAIVPIVATIGGVVTPAALYLVITASDASARDGWAIPTATDVAFALAVLAVVGSRLPPALRAFLLTLAVIDDLIAITVIAVLFTDDVSGRWLVAAVPPLVAFGLVARLRRRGWWVLLPPLGILTWVAMHESHVHATVAGVLLGLSLPVTRRTLNGVQEDRSVGEVIGHAVAPFSSGLAVPVFAFFAAGVTLSELGSVASVTSDTVVIGIIVALVLGKSLGIAGGAWLAARFTRAELDDALSWTDVIGLAFIAGIGFTVSLLIGELAFGEGTERTGHVKLAVLVGSVVAAAIGAAILRARDRHHRLME